MNTYTENHTHRGARTHLHRGTPMRTHTHTEAQRETHTYTEKERCDRTHIQTWYILWEHIHKHIHSGAYTHAHTHSGRLKLEHVANQGTSCPSPSLIVLPGFLLSSFLLLPLHTRYNLSHVCGWPWTTRTHKRWVDINYSLDFSPLVPDQTQPCAVFFAPYTPPHLLLTKLLLFLPFARASQHHVTRPCSRLRLSKTDQKVRTQQSPSCWGASLCFQSWKACRKCEAYRTCGWYTIYFGSLTKLVSWVAAQWLLGVFQVKVLQYIYTYLSMHLC